MTFPKIYVTLIHNHVDSRLQAVRPEVNKVVKSLRGRFTTEFAEIAWQPSSLPTNAFREWFAQALLLRYETLFPLYVARAADRRSLRNTLLLVSKLFVHALRAFGRELSLATEYFLSEKHVRAWQKSVYNEEAFCLVLEDDVRSVSNSDFQPVWDFLAAVPSQERVGIFLSIPFRVRGSGVRFDEGSRCDFGHSVSPAVANSSAAYVLSPALAKDMSIAVIDRPWLRFLPADLMINEVFRIIQGQTALTVYHVDRELFQNGSLTGATPSLLKHSYK